MRSLGAPPGSGVASLIAISIAITAGSGCFAPNAPEGNPCAPGALCPDGLSCINQVCVSESTDPIDAPPGGGPEASPDLDLDGVLNSTDNCPAVANPLQHDEDSDKVGDLCDNCPHVSNGPQANADSDGVGDACDPSPTTAGDNVAMFIAFDQTTLPAGVTTVGGTWSKTATGDMYQQTNTDPRTLAALLIDGVRDGATIEISGKTTGMSNDFVWLTTTFGEATGSSRYYSCGFVDIKDINPDDTNLATIEEYDGIDYFYVSGTPVANQLANNAAFKITAKADSAARSISCSTSDPRAAASSSTTGALRLTPGRLGIRSNGVAYTLNYIIVLGR
jgi:hypothetical protein